MELVKRLPIEIVRAIYSYGSAELRQQKKVFVAQVRTRLPFYINSFMKEQYLGAYFLQIPGLERERIFKNVRKCCCCARHLSRRPTHDRDGRIMNFHNRHDEPECDCACRYIMRRLSRT